MESILSSLLQYDDNTIHGSMLRLLAQYHRNQELYNQNTETMLTMMQTMLQRRTRNTSPNAANEYTFEFTIPLDPSGTAIRSLSANEISQRTTIFNYEYEEGEEPRVCPISLETIENNERVMKINRCGHTFKEHALRRWLQSHRQCPVCRGNVSN